MASFLAELYAVVEHCNFGNTLDNMLRDKLDFWINDNNILKHLLAEGDLTLVSSYKSAVRDATVLLPSGEL